MQTGITVSNYAITGTLKYLSSGQLVTDWGEGYFLALKFSGDDTSTPEDVKVGLEPSVSSGLLPLDSDKNGVFKITDKDTQYFVVQYDGKTVRYTLNGLTLQATE